MSWPFATPAASPAGDTNPTVIALTWTTPQAPGAALVPAFLSSDAGPTFAGTVTLDHPRNVRVTWGWTGSWDGGVITVAGTDVNGNPQTEDFTYPNAGGATVAGTKIFVGDVSATKAAVGLDGDQTATVEVGDLLLITTVQIAATWEVGTFAVADGGGMGPKFLAIADRVMDISDLSILGATDVRALVPVTPAVVT